jgi:hypothetical protein
MPVLAAIYTLNKSFQFGCVGGFFTEVDNIDANLVLLQTSTKSLEIGLRIVYGASNENNDLLLLSFVLAVLEGKLRMRGE